MHRWVGEGGGAGNDGARTPLAGRIGSGRGRECTVADAAHVGRQRPGAGAGADADVSPEVSVVGRHLGVNAAAATAAAAAAGFESEAR